MSDDVVRTSLDPQSCVKMKTDRETVLTFARKLVVDQPRALTLVEGNRSAMRQWKWQSTITTMFTTNSIEFLRCFPKQEAGLRFVADNKWYAHVCGVLFFAVYFDRRVISG